MPPTRAGCRRADVGPGQLHVQRGDDGGEAAGLPRHHRVRHHPLPHPLLLQPLRPPHAAPARLGRLFWAQRWALVYFCHVLLFAFVLLVVLRFTRCLCVLFDSPCFHAPPLSPAAPPSTTPRPLHAAQASWQSSTSTPAAPPSRASRRARTRRSGLWTSPRRCPAGGVNAPACLLPLHVFTACLST